MTKPPADCMTKEDVRAEIDRTDQGCCAAAERHRYVTRMAEIKTDPHEAYDPTRIEAIISKQRPRRGTRPRRGPGRADLAHADQLERQLRKGHYRRAQAPRVAARPAKECTAMTTTSDVLMRKAVASEAERWPRSAISPGIATSGPFTR